MNTKKREQRPRSRRQVFRVVGLGGLTAIGAAIGLAPSSPHVVQAQQASGDTWSASSVPAKGYEVLFSVVVGPGSVQYSQNEPSQWGPAALTVAPDGSFVIANGVSRNLLHFNSAGQLLKTTDYPTDVLGVTDIKATDKGIFALDGAAQAVFLLDYQGAVIATHEIPSELQPYLTGIIVGERGELLLEVMTKITHQLLDASNNRVAIPVAGFTVEGKLITIQSPTDEEPSRGGITVGVNKIDVSVTKRLASPRLLGSGIRGSFYAIVDELSSDEQGRLQVDEVVHHYRLDGKLLGMAKFPLMEQYVSVGHPLAIGGDGAVYALLTRQESVEVVRLNFQGLAR